jgi:hypothetical protein
VVEKFVEGELRVEKCDEFLQAAFPATTATVFIVKKTPSSPVIPPDPA